MIKNNYKNIVIIIITALVICFLRSNLKNSSSLAFSLSNEIYQFTVDKLGKKTTIASRVKEEASKCGVGYAISDWTFEKEAEIYRNNTIYGCTAELYGKKNNCHEPVNLKLLNNAYNSNYVLENGWWQDLYSVSSTKESPKIFDCNFKNGKSSCENIEKYGFFKFQIFCSIQGTMNPVKCEEIIDEAIRKPNYVEIDGETVEIKKSIRQAREEYIDNIVKNRNPIKNIKFVIIREKDDRFLRALILTDLSDQNRDCEGNIGILRLIEFANDLQ